MNWMRSALRGDRATCAFATVSSVIFSSVIGVVMVQAVHAEGASENATADKHEGVLEEVVVTARRRVESLQDVPISVTAFSAESIKQNNIQGVDDFFARTPNVSYVTEGSRDRRKLSIRGVTDFINAAGQGEVPTNTFGIYMDEFSVGTATSNPGVMDIERIEVLRGPQGTYFGRNAVGGAINIITKKPDNDYFAEVSTSVARFGTYDVESTFNMPIVQDVLAVRFNAKYDQSDGNIRNINPIGGGNDSEYKYARVSARYTPNERFTWDLVGSASDEVVGMRGGVPSGVLSAFTKSLYGPIPDPDGVGFWPQNTDKVNFNRPQKVGSKYHYIESHAEYRFDSVKLTSVTGYLKSNTYLTGDVDGGSKDLFYETDPFERNSISQELRLQSIENKHIDWTVGAIWSRDRGDVNQVTQAGNAQPFGLPSGFVIQANKGNSETRGTALFGEAVWHTTDKFDLLLGLRATQDNLETTELSLQGTNVYQAISAGDKFTDVSPKLSASYKFRHNSNVYATISKGYKSGGVQLGTNLTDPSYKPETIWNYELGVKTDFLDGRARLDASVFYMKWRNLQASFAVAAIDSQGTITFQSGIQNAAAATNYGTEAEFSFLATDNLLLHLSGGYLHAKFDKFTNAYVDGAIYDLSGRPMVDAPEVTASADAQYNFPITANYKGFARVEWFYRDKTYTDISSLVYASQGFPWVVPSFSNVNFRIGADGERFSVAAYLENVFNKKYFTNAYEKAFTGGMYLEPSFQTYGVRFTYKTH